MPTKTRARHAKENTQALGAPSSPPPALAKQKPTIQPVTEDDPNPDPIRSKAFYLAAGDVALSARRFLDADCEMEPSTIFRVETGFLAHHLSVFAAKFEAVSVLDSEKQYYDGVPVVELKNHPDDLEDLLSYMYNPASLFTWSLEHEKDVGKRMKHLLDIADYYKVDGVKSLVLHLLERDWPTTRVEWLRQHDEASRLKDLWRARCADLRDLCPDRLWPVDAATAIAIGLKHDMPTILPVAFYELSAIDIQDDWDRWHRSDKRNYAGRESAKTTDPRDNWRRTARWSTLNRASLMRVLLGKRALEDRRAVLGRVYDLDRPMDDKKEERRCVHELRALRKDYDKQFAGDSVHQPLQALMTMLISVNDNEILCRACRSAVRRNINRETERLWNDLPRMFDLMIDDDSDETLDTDSEDVG